MASRAHIGGIEFEWNPEKDLQLATQRQVSFSVLLNAMHAGGLRDLIDSPTKSPQLMLVVEYRDYIYYVPFVRVGDTYFLKTTYPTRDGTRRYLKK